MKSIQKRFVVLCVVRDGKTGVYQFIRCLKLLVIASLTLLLVIGNETRAQMAPVQPVVPPEPPKNIAQFEKLTVDLTPAAQGLFSVIPIPDSKKGFFYGSRMVVAHDWNGKNPTLFNPGWIYGGNATNNLAHVLTRRQQREYDDFLNNLRNIDAGYDAELGEQQIGIFNKFELQGRSRKSSVISKPGTAVLVMGRYFSFGLHRLKPGQGVDAPDEVTGTVQIEGKQLQGNGAIEYLVHGSWENVNTGAKDTIAPTPWEDLGKAKDGKGQIKVAIPKTQGNDEVNIFLEVVTRLRTDKVPDPPPAAQLPEPATWLLGLTGLAAVVGSQAWKKRYPKSAV